MFLHLKHELPRVVTIPLHKKPVNTSTLNELGIYYSKKIAFIYDESNHRLIASFPNTTIVLLNNDKNENKILFSLIYQPDSNDNEVVNHATITSGSIIQKVREICNNLYEVSINDNDSKPTILVDKQVVAYTMVYPRIVYYKLLKTIEGLRWVKDDEENLSDIGNERKAKYEPKEIADKYYVIGGRAVSRTSDGYYSIYKELCLYDLHKRKVIETAIISELRDSAHGAHETFDKMRIVDNAIFWVEDKAVVKPIVYMADGAHIYFKIDIPNNDSSEKTIEMDVFNPFVRYVPIMLFCSESNIIVVTTKIIFERDLIQSPDDTFQNYLHPKAEKDIDTKRMKLYKHKNFFILFDKSYIIAVYYNKKDSKYYFKYSAHDNGDLYKFKVIGHVLLRNANDECVGMIMASPDNKIIMTVYDFNKKEIYISDIIEYNYSIARKKDIDLLLHIILLQNKSSNFVLRLLSKVELLHNEMNVIQKENSNCLNAFIGKDVKVVIAGNYSHLPLNMNEFYGFKHLNYILTYEQPCLVRIIRYR